MNQSMFDTAFNTLQIDFSHIACLKPATDRQSWQSVPDEFKQLVKRRVQLYRDLPWPRLSASCYLLYSLEGDRSQFEKSYQEIRQRLNDIVIYQCIFDDDLYVNEIIDGIMFICEESGWQLPAHNTYVRDTPALNLPQVQKPIIDIYAAQTGAQLALITYLLASKLDLVSHTIRERIFHEIHSRIINPYLNAKFWWMGNGDEMMCNWSAWCTQNILLLGLFVPMNKKIRRAIVEQACYTLNCFEKDYGADGACPEGVLYYRHAALCLFNCIEMLNGYTKQHFAKLWKSEKVMNMASFLVNNHVDQNWYINFSDSSARLARCDIREYLFAQAVDSKSLRQLAINDWQESRRERSSLANECNLYYELQSLFFAKALNQEKPAAIEYSNIYYPSTQQAIFRDENFVLSVKAGNNGDSHNHNDVGSFTVFKKGQPLIIDIGVETYNKNTFSEKRYEIWTLQSSYHNLPSFDGNGQQAGKEFSAQDVHCNLETDQAFISMDISGAYKNSVNLHSYCRKVSLRSDSSIAIEDRFACASSSEVTMSLILAQKPTSFGNKVQVGDLASLSLDGLCIIAIESIAITDERLACTWSFHNETPHEIFRVLLKATSTDFKIIVN